MGGETPTPKRHLTFRVLHPARYSNMPALQNSDGSGRLRASHHAGSVWGVCDEGDEEGKEGGGEETSEPLSRHDMAHCSQK